jgi:DNA polymerase III subunit delta'
VSTASIRLDRPRPPWLEEPCETLERAVAQDRLPHAVLLQIGAGQGGEWLARWLAARIFCPTVCGDCLACRRVQAGEHPDLQLLSPEESTEIRIEQVRSLAEQFALTRHGSGRKVAIITPADRLNRNAANALLKTLEEPSGEALIVLVTAKPARLPQTIGSRCLRLVIPPPSMSAMVDWLEQSASMAGAAMGSPAEPSIDWSAVLEIMGPAPLSALEVDHTRVLAIRQAAQGAVRDAMAGRLDPPVIAERWSKDDFAWYLTALERCAQSELRESSLRQFVAAAKFWLELIDELNEARRWADTPVNKSLVIQRLLWRLSAVRTILSRA